jgi:hypothetical protein
LINNRPVERWALPAHVGASRSALNTLRRDFARLRTLDHPHIARVLELGSNGKQYYVTAERLDGEPLRDVLTHLLPERLDVGEADEIVRAVGSALIFAHEHDLPHGDVRAENVLVTMDRKFVLTNFLARRVAKVSARPPRPRDDVRGLARLAAELYTGSASPQALRGALHGDVPPARLSAIRAVLQAAGGKTGTVAEFLAAAGLTLGGAGARVRRPDKAPRISPPWRFALPVGAAIAIAAWLAWSPTDWRASADQWQERGLDALRSVATSAAGKPAQSTRAPRSVDTERPTTLPETVETPEPEPVQVASPDEAPAPPLPELQPAAATAPERPVAAPGAATAAATPPGSEPAVLSLAVRRIAAREDHSVVAVDVERTGNTQVEAAVQWWTTPDTADADDDYVSSGRGTLTFPPGVTAGRLLIPLVNDGVRERDETFTVNIGDRPHGGVAGAVKTTRVTLYDDD